MFEVGAFHQTIWEKGRIRDTKLAEGNRWIALFQIVFPVEIQIKNDIDSLV